MIGDFLTTAVRTGDEGMVNIYIIRVEYHYYYWKKTCQELK